MARSKVYACQAEGCNKVYLSFQGFKEHRKEHGVVRYPCLEPGCGKTFKWRSSLASHKKSHQVRAVSEKCEKSVVMSPVSSMDTCSEASIPSISNESARWLQEVSDHSSKEALREVGIYGHDDNENLYLIPCEDLSMDGWDM